MIKYFKNGVLEAETVDLPQDCGDIKVSVTMEEELVDVCYYLEFSCPRNVKYISQRLQKVEDGKYELLLPRGISEYMGEVYVQLVIMSKTEEKLICRSLIARDPLCVIKESILATNKLESSEKRDFFEYSQAVVSNAQNKIDVIDGLIENIPSVVQEKIGDTLSDINNAISSCNTRIENNSADIANKIDKSQIAQSIGTSEDMVMSQKAVSDKLKICFPKSDVVQCLGINPHVLVSQKGIYSALVGTIEMYESSRNAVTIELADPKYDTKNGRCIYWLLLGFVNTSSTLKVYDNESTIISAIDAIGFMLAIQTDYASILVFKKNGTMQTYWGMKNNIKVVYQNIFGPLLVLDSNEIRKAY